MSPARAAAMATVGRAPAAPARAVDAAAVTLARVAQVTGGRVDGDAGFTVAELKSLESADAGSLAFYAGQRRAGAALKNTAAGAVMLRADHAGEFPRHKIIVAEPYLAYARASALFAPPAPPPGIHSTAVIAAHASVAADAAVGAFTVIGPGARIGPGAVIGAHASVGDNCVIGGGTRLDPGARIYPGVRIGRRCRIAAGAVIGAPGFGYAPGGDNGDGGEWTRIEQLGGVLIGDEVDIGAHTAIDRGALDDTVIADGVKLDNHIQIAHNVSIGPGTIMAGCVAVAGSTVIGARCQFGGRASILGHLVIADDVRVLAGGFVAKSILQPGEYSSLIPAMPAARWRRVIAGLRRPTGECHD